MTKHIGGSIEGVVRLLVLFFSTPGSMSLAGSLLAPLLTALDTRVGIQEALRSAKSQDVIRRASEAGDADGMRALEKSITSWLGTSPSQNANEPAWAVGADVAHAFVEQCGWSVVEVHGHAWVQRAIAHLEHVAAHGATTALLVSVAPLARLAMFDIMGRESESHPEFHRAVTAPHITKMGHAIVSVCEACHAATSSRALAQLFDALAFHVGLYSNTYRTHVARVHALCMQTLFGPYAAMEASVTPCSAALVKSATQLLAALHLTGSVSTTNTDRDAIAYAGPLKLSQAQLWAATMQEMLDGLVTSLHGCAPSVPWAAWGVPSPTAAMPLAWTAPVPDYTISMPACLHRCELLLGSSGSMGVVPWYMSTPTPRAVPVPVARCVAIATAMIQARISRDDAPVDRLRYEETFVPRLREMGARFLVHVVKTFQQSCWVHLYAAQSIHAVCAMAERAAGAQERTQALCALYLLLSSDSEMCAAVPLDPASPTVQRIARLCIQTQSAYVVQEPASWTCAPPLKRVRAFESDAVHVSSRAPQDAIMVKSSDALDAVRYAVLLYVSLFGLLASSAAPGHRDLARTGAMALVGLVEALVDARILDASNEAMVRLCEQCIHALTMLATTHTGALIAYILPRVHAVLNRGAQSRVPRVRCACALGTSALLPILRPRVPPLVDVVDSSAFEERIPEADAQDHVPLPTPAWHDSHTVALTWSTVADVAPTQPPVAAPKLASPAPAPQFSTPPEAPMPASSLAPAPAPPLVSSVDDKVDDDNDDNDDDDDDEEAMPTLDMQASDDDSSD